MYEGSDVSAGRCREDKSVFYVLNVFFVTFTDPEQRDTLYLNGAELWRKHGVTGRVNSRYKTAFVTASATMGAVKRDIVKFSENTKVSKRLTFKVLWRHSPMFSPKRVSSLSCKWFFLFLIHSFDITLPALLCQGKKVQNNNIPTINCFAFFQICCCHSEKTNLQ